VGKKNNSVTPAQGRS